jgi:hypothetical protein
MNLYNSFCYATIQDVANSIQSEPFIGSSILVSATVNGISIDLVLETPKQTNGINVTTHTIYPPECTQLGFNNSYSGLTTVDALELSGLALLVFVVAWGGKMLRRAT